MFAAERISGALRHAWQSQPLSAAKQSRNYVRFIEASKRLPRAVLHNAYGSTPTSCPPPGAINVADLRQ
jgi:hypothetical protein